MSTASGSPGGGAITRRAAVDPAIDFADEGPGLRFHTNEAGDSCGHDHSRDPSHRRPPALAIERDLPGRGRAGRAPRRSRVERRQCHADAAWDLSRDIARSAAAPITGCRWRQRRPIRLALQDRGNHIGTGFSSERRAAGQHLVQHAPESPDVGPLVDRSDRVPAPGSCTPLCRESCLGACSRSSSSALRVAPIRSHIRRRAFAPGRSPDRSPEP